MYNTTLSKRNQRFLEKQVIPDLEEFHESKKSFSTKRKHKWELRSLRFFWRVLDVNFKNRIIWPSRRARTLKGLSILNMLKLLCEHSCVHNDTERKKKNSSWVPCLKEWTHYSVNTNIEYEPSISSIFLKQTSFHEN